RRRGLGGSLPKRSTKVRRALELPGDKPFSELRGGSGNQEVSTTMGFTRLLRNLARDEHVGPRVVPIIPDEARTFGMDALFREIGIYAPHGQLYEPVDHELLLSYKESSDGQILEEGITEAGGLASWTAAATSHAHRGVPMVPFYTFYSMFGFQRVGDLIWAAADARARGFLLGATAGRTTLLGEGLQHQDGHSQLLASAVPVCHSYDPAFAFETALIVRDGIAKMYPGDGSPGDDRFYYLTLYNENYPMPPMPDDGGTGAIEQGVVDGLYCWQPAPEGTGPEATIVFSGTAWSAAVEARDILAEHYGIRVSLWSATSFQQLRLEAMEVERWNRLHPLEAPRRPKVTQILEPSAGPVVAVTDFMRAVPDQIEHWIPDGRLWCSLGTDGFGRSDTREALRRFFETDAPNVVVAVLHTMAESGIIDHATTEDAIRRYDVDPGAAPSWITP
ncbi:MAG: transketolase-like TK C-terminal-containing protein, partial [Microthrixaceae bacterium]